MTENQDAISSVDEYLQGIKITHKAMNDRMLDLCVDHAPFKVGEHFMFDIVRLFKHLNRYNYDYGLRPCPLFFKLASKHVDFSTWPREQQTSIYQALVMCAFPNGEYET